MKSIHLRVRIFGNHLPWVARAYPEPFKLHEFVRGFNACVGESYYIDVGNEVTSTARGTESK